MSRRRQGGRGWNAERDSSPVRWRARRRLWLRRLGLVKRELEHERYPRSASEGLSAMAALSEIGLSLGGGGRGRVRRTSGALRG